MPADGGSRAELYGVHFWGHHVVKTLPAPQCSPQALWPFRTRTGDEIKGVARSSKRSFVLLQVPASGLLLGTGRARGECLLY